MLEDNKEVALADSTRAVPIPEEPQPQQLPQDTLRSAMEADLEQAPVATDTLRESQRLIKPTSIPEEPGR